MGLGSKGTTIFGVFKIFLGKSLEVTKKMRNFAPEERIRPTRRVRNVLGASKDLEYSGTRDRHGQPEMLFLCLVVTLVVTRH